MRIVQKGAVDNVRTFNTIQGALGSITDESSLRRYLIKVMPGIFQEQITLRSFIEIEGSGLETTTIEGGISIYSPGNERPEDITVKHLTLSNPDGNPVYIAGGIMLLDSVRITGLNGFYGDTFGGAVIINSKIEAVNTGILMCHDMALIENTTVSGNTALEMKCVFTSERLVIKKSELNGGSTGISMSNFGNLYVYDSIVRGGYAVSYDGGGSGKFHIAGSQMDGDFRPAPETNKIINSYDGNFNPINNQ